MKEFYKVLITIVTFLIVNLYVTDLVVYKILLYETEKSNGYYKKINVEYEDTSYSITVKENFEIVTERFWNVVYRSFSDSICFRGKCNVTIKDVNCKIGVPYISLPNDTVYIKTNGQWRTINKKHLIYGMKIHKNEVGCYSNEMFMQKTEFLNVTYDLPKNYVELYNYKHYFFTNEHPPILKFSTNSYTTEKIIKDVPILIDINTGRVYVKDYKELIFFIIITSYVIVFIIWYIFGRDKDILVPRYLHRKPINPETGREEDYITYGIMYSLGVITPNIITSLLFSLKLNGLLTKIEKRGRVFKEFLFYFDKNKLANMDITEINNFEKQFVKNIFLWGEKIEKNGYIIIKINVKRTRKKFLRFFIYIKNSVLKNRVEDISMRILKFFLAILFLSNAFLMIILSNKMPLLVTIYMHSSVILLVFLATLIGILRKELIRFKHYYYKEYLEIKAFKRLLEDYAQLQRYLPEDIVLWKDWLLIATALGVADNVIKVLRNRGFVVDDLLKDYKNTSVIATHLHTSIIESSRKYSGRRFGGVVGGGGGGR